MVQLYIRQKIFSASDKYKIYDEYQRVVFQCKSKILSWGSKIKMYDASGENLIYYIKEKIRFSFYRKYYIYDNVGNEICCIKQDALIKPKLVIKMSDGSDEFDIKGNWLAYEFSILNDKLQIGSVRKKVLSWADTYNLDINDSFNPALFAAFVIVVDTCYHNNNNNN
ncbi:hypothetical protein DICPUDRAFT_151024 [Dictyostelium purpureum]|uniref:Tubby C-terminal domain-containing protein n=1 Tax=Dictyostelium purpureum TaxID=5786 RepID=F0ZHT8_DICPU|nr:uncharacterized protein DICPUDRAFT_151024 [Dictyostelium purpureum]EGC36467.1 hypothetical protein DICPUDRAFT_151024 [Dictyostelium purpureum]|eukprot:XP_003286980.1 hypothetical protein DICPUDRAFT_151024 [Dictyostelium purpureum]